MTADDVTLTEAERETLWGLTITPGTIVAVERILADRLAAVQAEADRWRSLHNESTASARDYWRRAESAERRLAEVEAQFEGAREDIRARKREFARLGADREYLNALDDAFGLVANRVRAALATEGDQP